MNPFNAASLRVRLAARLGALFLVATLALAAVFAYLSMTLVDTLSRRDLSELAEELADEIEDEGNLEDLDRLYARGWINIDTEYLILDPDGRIVAESNPSFRSEVMAQDLHKKRSADFRLESFGEPSQRFFGLVTRERTDVGRLKLIVAEPERKEQEVLEAMLHDLVFQISWILPLFVILTLLVGMRAIRGGLEPLDTTAEEVAAIEPDSMSIRLDTGHLPREIVPFVRAINAALDRLECGFENQRRFTANAAHELRTPLTIVTGELESMGDDEQVQKLRGDVARMNRVVEQLLHVARLDAPDIDTSGVVDLGMVARQVVEMLAPLVIQADKTIELSGPDTKTMVLGDEATMEDALRNLIENAIAHGSPGTRIGVRLSSDGAISVSDQGPGIPEDQRENLFDRFSRGRNSAGKAGGAGLGLAIVREIMKLHGGSVSLESNSEGGACFTLRFQKA